MILLTLIYVFNIRKNTQMIGRAYSKVGGGTNSQVITVIFLNTTPKDPYVAFGLGHFWDGGSTIYRYFRSNC
jgi:hypothetical protein